LSYPTDFNFIKKQIDAIPPSDELKIFVSGSLLDKKQFPDEALDYLVKALKQKGIKRLTIESRLEYITDENLKIFKDFDLTVAIGLEVANDEKLRMLQKGITLKMFEDAVKILKRNNVKLRVYLLVNAPFTSKQDFLDSYNYAKKFTDDIVAINCYPHVKAPIFDMWIKGEWRPLDKHEFEEWTKGLDVERDFTNFNFVPRIPKEKWDDLRGVGEKYLTHPHYDVWQDYFARFYKVPKGKEYVLFLPCSYVKPYRKSKTHRAIISTLVRIPNHDKVHQVMISSPGVIPREYENEYPFAYYDWPEDQETPEIKKRYIEVTRERIKNYLSHHKYKKVFAYLRPDSESYIALKQACDELGINLITCLDENTYKRVKGKPRALADPLCLDKLKQCLTFNLTDVQSDSV